jgi:AcrR family transcriptional regulator
MPAHPHTSTAELVAAGRRILEERGLDGLTMRGVAGAVGVRAPSLYKRVRGREDLIRLILEDVADELTAVLDAAAGTGHAPTDLRAMVEAYRRFARAHPTAHGLMFTPGAAAGATARAQRSSATLLRVTGELAGPDHALPAARMVVAWAHGFVTMELAGAFRLGGDIETAWDYGIGRLVDALSSRTGGSPTATT